MAFSKAYGSDFAAFCVAILGAAPDMTPFRLKNRINVPCPEKAQNLKEKTMHDIWNPWHGCFKKSPGCQNCYMYFLDRKRGQNGSKVYKVAQNFDYPLQKDAGGHYKIKSGEQIRVCMTSDFFLEEADQWRHEAWKIIAARPDVLFFLLTKRPERVLSCLPPDWNDGWNNVFFNVSCENQAMAVFRLWRHFLSSIRAL
jgi:protein gp37